jgi:A/G-specific adenine glycosylase
MTSDSRPKRGTVNAVWVRRRLLAWGRKNYRRFPWRSDKNLYRALVTEVLLQQTGADRVARIRPTLLREYPRERNLARALPIDVERIIRPLGLSQQRSERLVALAQALLGKSFHQRSAADLLGLPGIGPWNRAEPALDVNSARILARVFGTSIARGEARRHRQVRFRAHELVNGTNPSAINYALLDLGAKICRPRPKCDECPLAARCVFFSNRLHSGLEATTKGRAITSMEMPLTA